MPKHRFPQSPAIGRCQPDCPTPCMDADSVRRHLASKIRRWRKDDCHTLESLAAILRVSRSTISLWERGKRLPSLEHLIALAKIMNEPPCGFFCPAPDNRQSDRSRGPNQPC